MSSFFTKARERAHDALGEASKFTYTGSLPHTLRQGLAQVDPRYESTRSFHLLSGALKSVSIDHEATARETQAAARATFHWGQDQAPSKREDGAGDEAIVDVTDRLAFIFSQVGDLEQAHVKRSEEARSQLKAIQKAEQDLSVRRDKRIRIKQELLQLVPARARPNGPQARIVELESQLSKLEAEDKLEEESLGRLKRHSVRDAYERHFDSLMELGEKLALVARYGKLLTHQIPTEPPPFPAPRPTRAGNEANWKGAERTAEIRAAVEHALKAYVPQGTLPELPLATGSGSGSVAGGGTSALNRHDTSSFAVSHRAELESEGRNSQTHPGLARTDSNLSVPPSLSATSGSGSGHLPTVGAPSAAYSTQTPVPGSTSGPPSAGAGAGLQTLPERGILTASLNMSPTSIPAPTSPLTAPPPIPPRGGSTGSVSGGGAGRRVPPLPPAAGQAQAQGHMYSTTAPGADEMVVPSPLPSTSNFGAISPEGPAQLGLMGSPISSSAGASGSGPGSGLPLGAGGVVGVGAGREEQEALGTAPANPTVAETGAPISGTAGPKSGSLGVPRRLSKSSTDGASASSSTSTSANASMPGTYDSSATGPAAPTQPIDPASEARARKEAEAAREAEQVRLHATNARIPHSYPSSHPQAQAGGSSSGAGTLGQPAGAQTGVGAGVGAVPAAPPAPVPGLEEETDREGEGLPAYTEYEGAGGRGPAA